MTSTYSPAYGYMQISDDGRELIVTGTRESMRRWAERPDESWPCSMLARAESVSATLDARGDLVALDVRPRTLAIPADELSAWLDAAILQAWREVATRRPLPVLIVDAAYRREQDAASSTLDDLVRRGLAAPHEGQ